MITTFFVPPCFFFFSGDVFCLPALPAFGFTLDGCVDEGPWSRLCFPLPTHGSWLLTFILGPGTLAFFYLVHRAQRPPNWCLRVHDGPPAIPFGLVYPLLPPPRPPFDPKNYCLPVCVTRYMVSPGCEELWSERLSRSTVAHPNFL